MSFSPGLLKDCKFFNALGMFRRRVGEVAGDAAGVMFSAAAGGWGGAI